MSMQFRDVTATGSITPEDILALRRSVWSNGLIDAGEAEQILAINAANREPCAEWTDFFVEALSVWLIDQQEPRGYVDDAQAEWLIARLDRGSGVETMAELELLVRVLEKATSAPARLRQFALAQTERAVLEARWPTRDGAMLEPGRVTAGEARLLRRLIFAAGSDRPAAVSQAEAEMLFRIKDATRDADNAPEWRQLFVQGVGNHLQASGGAEPLARERERELERFIAAPAGGLGSFIGRMARVHPNGLTTATRDVLSFGRKPVTRDWEGEAERAAAIDPGEQSWLDGQVQADGEIDAYEQALMDFLKDA